MLRTNLSTRPFYDERAVHGLLAILGVVALVVLVTGVDRLVELSRANTELTAMAQQAERVAAEIATEVAALERGIGAAEIETTRGAAEEANRLIDQRVFSWTEFFNVIERTLPADVMLTVVRPHQTDDGTFLELGVIGRRIADIDEFIERLEATGAFADILARQEELNDDGMYRAQLLGELVSRDITAGEPTAGS